MIGIWADQLREISSFIRSHKKSFHSPTWDCRFTNAYFEQYAVEVVQALFSAITLTLMKATRFGDYNRGTGSLICSLSRLLFTALALQDATRMTARRHLYDYLPCKLNHICCCKSAAGSYVARVEGNCYGGLNSGVHDEKSFLETRP